LSAPRTTNSLPNWLKLWVRALDTVCGEVGIVTGLGHPYAVNEVPTVAYLRPIDGDMEWQCAIADLRPAPSSDRPNPGHWA
jgi:hypothetical protein